MNEHDDARMPSSAVARRRVSVLCVWVFLDFGVATPRVMAKIPKEILIPEEALEEAGGGDSETLLSRRHFAKATDLTGSADTTPCQTKKGVGRWWCCLAVLAGGLLCLTLVRWPPPPCTQAELPVFANDSDGFAPPWVAYATALYGNQTPPPDPGSLTMFYASMLERAGIHLTVSRDASCVCSMQNGTLSSRGRASPWDPPDTLWRWDRDRTPLPNHSQVEVTHCTAAQEVIDASDRELEGAWFFITPGSGIFLDTGRTRAFDTHQEAVRAFVDADVRCYQCIEHFYDLVRNARAAGLDSLQILHHDDQNCGNMAIELIHVHGKGFATCANVTLWKGDGTLCECDSALRCASCV